MFYGWGWTNKLLNSLRLSSLRLVIVKTWIVKLVVLSELKVKMGSVRYMFSCARELLVKLVKKFDVDQKSRRHNRTSSRS
jgi:hypothetical protein